MSRQSATLIKRHEGATNVDKIQKADAPHLIQEEEAEIETFLDPETEKDQGKGHTERDVTSAATGQKAESGEEKAALFLAS